VPFFFLVPLWLVLSVVGAVLLFWRRLRFLSPYIVLGSTVGLACSFAFSLVVLLILGKLFRGTSVAWLALAAYLVAIVIGGGVGVIGGLLLGRTVNSKLGWSSK
jgi:hypothetical protein